MNVGIVAQLWTNQHQHCVGGFEVEVDRVGHKDYMLAKVHSVPRRLAWIIAFWVCSAENDDLRDPSVNKCSVFAGFLVVIQNLKEQEEREKLMHVKTKSKWEKIVWRFSHLARFCASQFPMNSLGGEKKLLPKYQPFLHVLKVLAFLSVKVLIKLLKKDCVYATQDQS